MTFTNGFQVVLIGGGVLAAAYVFVWWLRKLFGAIKITRTVVTVNEHERGVKYVQGKLAGVVQPGRYAWWGESQIIEKLDVRPRFETIPGQEVLTSDAVGVRTSLALQYQVADAVMAMSQSQSYNVAAYQLVQTALRESVGVTDIDALLSNRGALDQQLKERVTPQFEALGLKLLNASVKDIMLSGDLKQTFAQVVKARQEGLAALERARGETAALRSLANAARLLESNPTLMQLRILQTLGETKGNTIVLNATNEAVSIIKRTE